MLETICKSCGQRYQLGTEHKCQRARPRAKAPTIVLAEAPVGPAPVDVLMMGPGYHYEATSFAEIKAQIAVDAPKPRRGRPKTITDMKAYRLQKQRERRARIKARPPQ